MIISDALRNVRRLAIETAPFIYYVENHPVYADKMDSIFQFVQAENIAAVTSVVTFAEVLTKPLKSGDIELEAVYRELFETAEHIQLVDIDRIIADRAAHLRSQYNLKTPDAFQVAAAIDTACDAFLTNDSAIKRVKEVRVLILDELEIASATDSPMEE